MATSSETLAVQLPALIPTEPVASIARNVVFSVIDYLVQPLLVLITARYFVRTLGIPLFGVWMLVLTLIGSTGTLCTGFGDAALKYVSSMRGRLDRDGVAQVVGASLLVNASLALSLAVAFYWLAPWTALHAFHLSPEMSRVFVPTMRVAGAVLVVRALSFVFVGTLRGFECYDRATSITALTRVLIAVSALLLVWRGLGVLAIMLTTLFGEFAALCVLALSVVNLIGFRTVGARPDDYRALSSFAFFSWIQAIFGTLFSQADRLMIAALLGPAALAYYGVCVQCAQPIHGLAASGCNVLFPHLSTRFERLGTPYLRSVLKRSFRINSLCVAALTVPLVFLGRPVLDLWMGRAFSLHAATTLALIAVSFALLALNIPGHYALMALGRVRYLTALNVAGCALSLAIAWLLIPRFGIVGAAIGRISYGPLTWLLYGRLAAITSSENLL